MAPEECLESLVLRAIVGLMVFLVYLETKDTGVTQDRWDLQDLRERMEKGETTETLDPGVFQVNQAPEVCSDLKVLLESLVLLAFEEVTDPMVQRVTWVLRVSQGPLVSREPQELRECLDLKDTLDLQEKRVPQENQVYQECPELMALLVIQERRGLQAPKGTRVLVVPRGLLAILVLVASRAVKESVD